VAEANSTDGGVLLTVKVVPGSSRTALAGRLGEMIKIKVAAAPEKGRANEQLTEFLAKRLGIRRQQIIIVSGHTGPVKQLRIDGVEPEIVRDKLRP